MYPYRSGPHGTVKLSQQDLMSVVSACVHTTAHYIGAAERHERSVAEAAQNRDLKLAGLLPAKHGSIVASVRQAVGVALVGAGRRLQGAPRAEAAAGAAG
jgi:hypothetical protein